MGQNKTGFLHFRALPDDVALANRLADRLRCSRGEALRRALRVACGVLTDVESTKNSDSAEISQVRSAITAVA